MQSRRDHVQAHQFATNRLTSALITGDPGRGQTPFRRASLGLIAGIIIAALLSGGSVIYGLIVPASAATTWRQQGSVVVDEQTGTRFIYLDGTLHPTANYASAVLVAGTTTAVHAVPHSALANVPVGDTIGIIGAPETLPTAMLPGTWAICLAVGSAHGVALDLAPGQHATTATAGLLMLLAGPTGEEYVLWNNMKYPVAERAVLVAFGLGNTEPLQAPAGWLADLPTGPALASPTIRKLGTPGFPVSGRPTQIGTVFDASAAGANQYYVLLDNGLAPLSRTEAALLAASGRVGPVQHVSPAAIGAAPASPNRSLLGGLPDMLAGTAYQPSGTALCIRQTSPGGPSGNTVVTDSAAAAVSGVIVPSGTGMIVQPPSQSGFAAQPAYLVTDTGLKYALADGKAMAALGYGNVAPQVMPPSILSLIPSGPPLSVTAARAAVNVP